MSVTIKSRREVGLMRAAGVVVAEVHELMRQHAQPGVTTAELDRLAYELIVARGGSPSFLGYDGYPASICASVNAEIVHGIPNERPLQSGDILSIDVGVFLHGYHGDAAITLPIGEVSEANLQLIDAAEGAFAAGLSQSRAGLRIGDISSAIQEYAESRGFGLAEGLTGHGIGVKMHEAPQVPNTGTAGTGMRLRSGMTLAIEPMLTAGSPETVVLEDGWTIVTADGQPAAHYEHTVLVTDDEPVLLTGSGVSVVQ